MDRRTAFGQVAFGAAAVVGLAQPAFADGAVSGSTRLKARAVYGARIDALKDAVKAGDFAAVADEKNAFILYNSGTYPGAKDKAAKAAAIQDTNAIFAAIKAQDKKGLQTAYGNFVANNDVSPLPDVSQSNGQGYSGDYDYKTRTSAG